MTIAGGWYVYGQIGKMKNFDETALPTTVDQDTAIKFTALINHVGLLIFADIPTRAHPTKTVPQILNSMKEHAVAGESKIDNSKIENCSEA